MNRTGLPSLIVTIGTMFAVMGLTLGLAVWLTGSTSTTLTPAPMVKAALGTFLGGMFQITVFWWAGFAVLVGYLLHVSPIGSWIYALGGDKISARSSSARSCRSRL